MSVNTLNNCYQLQVVYGDLNVSVDSFIEVLANFSYLNCLER